MDNRVFRQEYLGEWFDGKADSLDRNNVLDWLNEVSRNDPLINNTLNHYYQMSRNEGRSTKQELEGYHFNDLVFSIIRIQHEEILNQQSQLLQLYREKPSMSLFNEENKRIRTKLSHNINTR